MPSLRFIAIFFSGAIAGILLQRYVPVGSVLHRLGLRHLLPIPRQGTSPSSMPLSHQDWDVPAADRGKLKLFVLAGQSNMSGRGSLISAAIPRLDERIFALNKDFRWSPATEPLGSRPNEVDTIASDGGTGVGPGLAFAHRLLEEHPDWRIGLVPCARGASLIADWQRDLSQNSLYGACLKRVQAASTYGDVVGFLFAQGEGDADDPTLHPERVLSAATWAERFTAIVTSLRKDLGLPGLPVVYAQLGQPPNPSPPNWELIKRQQAAVVVAQSNMVSTTDLVTADGVHFTTESQVEIGRRMAEAWLKLDPVIAHE